MAEIFDELEKKFAGHAAILGGDLNTARLAEKIWPKYGHGPFFERFESGPFFDCHRKFNPEEVQTFFRASQIHPIQDDHLFASRDLEERLESCTVIKNPETRRFSDHIPLIAEFKCLD
jgi:exonuclease III